MKLNLSKGFGAKCACPPEGLEIVVANLAGHLCTLHADCSCTIADVKEKIALLTGIPAREQRLLACERELSDEQTVRGRGTDLILLRRDKQQVEWLQIVSDWQDPRSLADAPESLRSDHEVVLAAVRHNGYDFRHASEELRADKKLAMLALESGCGAIVESMSPVLQADREVIFHALEHDSNHGSHGPLKYAANEVRRSREIALYAVQKQGMWLFDVAQELLHDPEIILSALQHKHMKLGGIP